MTDRETPKEAPFGWAAFPQLFTPAVEYATDFVQRQILFWDTLRRRGNQYIEASAKLAPHVLNYTFEVIADGRTFKQPVNYVLVRIVPPADVTFRPTARPFVIVDPRAGHGPGIGGFKADSEIGVAMKAGHPCYFIGFLADPMPGQTIEDIGRAEAIFLEKVMALHPEAEGKPCVIGNCQAGWAVMMLAAVRPELFGPIIIAGSPLSYWAGLRGINPMRYMGGLLGGSWLTAFTSDMGAGKFNGSWLVQNFESLNPANTLWSKHYNLYSNIDTETQRYLEFERWWGAHVSLNAEEIQFIVDELFIGNKLAAGDVKWSDGTAIDLRNVRSPIVVFCSKGDNITPPQQALGWILDLYKDVNEIRSYGQTIVYTIHEKSGHLGIFVSGAIARKEYREFSSNIDLIDLLPPGLYEATFERKTKDTVNDYLVAGEWIMRCEERTLDDIRALGGHEPEEERMFATVAQVSQANLALYQTFLQPLVQASVTPAFANWMRKMHPLRLQYEMFSDENPFGAVLGEMARQVRSNRKPVSGDNPFLQAEHIASSHIEQTLGSFGKIRDSFTEMLFLSIYGSPALQAAEGVDPKSTEELRMAPKSALHKALVRQRIAEIKARIHTGGLQECAIRGLIFVGLARGRVDERGVNELKELRLSQDVPPLSLAEFKEIARDQFYMMLLDPQATLAAIPSLLPSDRTSRQKAFNIIRRVLEASGELTGEAVERLARVKTLFGLDDHDRIEGHSVALPEPLIIERIAASAERAPEVAAVTAEPVPKVAAQADHAAAWSEPQGAHTTAPVEHVPEVAAQADHAASWSEPHGAEHTAAPIEPVPEVAAQADHAAAWPEPQGAEHTAAPIEPAPEVAAQADHVTAWSEPHGAEHTAAPAEHAPLGER